jgi:hypothetical protein
MRQSTRVYIAAAVIAMLAACQPAEVKSDKSSTDSKQANDASTQRYKMTPHQSSFGAQLTTQVPPTYPAALASQNLGPQEVRAKVVVDGEGRVSDVLDFFPKSTDANHAAFFAAVREAALKWQYTPMTVVEQQDTSGGGLREVSRTNKPFSLDYLFRFDVKDSQPTVSTKAVTP